MKNPSIVMKRNLQMLAPVKKHLIQCSGTKTDAAVDNLVLVEFALGTLAGVISYTSAVLTTFVESPGFWRYFWLMVCIATFVCATCLIIEGTRNFSTHK
jgi:hypothetical protein